MFNNLKKEKLLILVLIFAHSIVYGQECLKIDFLKTSVSDYRIQSIQEFKSDFEKSHFWSKEFISKADSLVETEVETIGNRTIVTTTTPVFMNFDDYITYKDYQNDTIVSYESIAGQTAHVNIIETMPKIKWQIHQELDSIGELLVQKATGEFGGREYEVWFSKEIPISDGPQKLNGLPGMILKAKSLDGRVKYEPKVINLFQGECDIQNPLLSHPNAKVYAKKEAWVVEEEGLKKNRQYNKSKTGGSYFIYEKGEGIEKRD